MAYAEVFLRLLMQERDTLSSLGMPGRPMIHALHEAIQGYRAAEVARDDEAKAAAQRGVDQILREHMSRVLAVVAEHPPWDQPT